METPITLPITYTVDDWVRVLTAMRNRIWWLKYGYLALPVSVFLAALLLVFFDQSESSLSLIELAGISLLVALVVGLVAFLAAKFFTPWTIKRSVARQIKSSPAMQAPHSIVLTDASLQISSEFASATINWTAFIEAIETETDFLLYTTKRFCQFIPKRACPSEAEWASIRELVAREVGFEEKQKG
jgi:hypothetical protein